MIHKPEKLICENKTWYYQAFTPDSLCDDSGCNLYNANGEFVREFGSYEEMKNWITQTKLLSLALNEQELDTVYKMCALAIFNFNMGAQQAYCPNEHETNLLQGLLAKVVNADTKG